MSRIVRRSSFLAFLAAAGAVLFASAGARAGVVGSPHDFSVTGPHKTADTMSYVAPDGACSGCHISHRAADSDLWARSLTQLKRPYHLMMDNLAAHDYVLPPAIQCYDCHDGDQIPAESQTPPYNDPDLGYFDPVHKPQNTLFGFKKTSTGTMTPFPAGPNAQKLVPGYYETNPAGPSGNDGVDTSAPLSQTGGHYFKQDPATTGPLSSIIDAGDKLPCRDCHDPHAWYNGQNQAFIRRNFPSGSQIPGRLGSVVKASDAMANAPTSPSPPRDNTASRAICAACHGYSNTSPVNFSDINSNYQNVAITGMNSGSALTIAEHASSATTACVTCHSHNSVGASCSLCHGFPPSPYPPNRSTTPPAAYTQRDPHAWHVGKEDGKPDNASLIYKRTCTWCHATSVMGSRSQDGIHATGAYNIAYDFSNMDYPPPTPPNVVSTGGLTCANVYCHSNGGSDNTMGGAIPANYFRSAQWGFTAPLGCNGCHGSTTPSNVIQTGMPDYTSGTAGSATANSHVKHVVVLRQECSVCHFNTVQGTYYGAGRSIKTAPLIHVNGGREVAFDGDNAVAGPGGYNVDGVTQANNKRCDVQCHGIGKPLLERPQWGGTVDCFSCHSGAEQIYKPRLDYSVPKSPNPVDNNEYLSSGHGRMSGNYPGDNNAPAGFGDYTTDPADCYYCHSRNAAHTTKNTDDPFRLGFNLDTTGQKGYVTGAFADDTDGLCLRCHGVPDLSNPQRAKGAAAQNMQTHAEGITGVNRAPWTKTPWKCVDCHDPHGDGKPGAERWMMVRSGINAPLNISDGLNAGSDPKSVTNRTSNISAIAFYSQAGFAAGSYAQPGNGSGGVWGPCEVCHNKPNTYTRAIDNAATHAGRTGRCTTCHPHSAGFGPKACKGCHGGETGDPGQVSNNAPNITAWWTTSGHGQAFASRASVVECEECHNVGYLSAANHKTDGTAGSGPPPANVNTLKWPTKADNGNNFPTLNTSHLKQDYFPSSATSKYQYALAFDRKCGTPATGCHLVAPHNHHPKIPAGSIDPTDNVMRFGDNTTLSNPKNYYWYPAYSVYRDSFYESRSPWGIDDLTTSAAVGSDSGVQYGACITCHDPHGTNSIKNLLGGATNRMLRGNSKSSGQFCNTACHRSP